MHVLSVWLRATLHLSHEVAEGFEVHPAKGQTSALHQESNAAAEQGATSHALQHPKRLLPAAGSVPAFHLPTH
eukprot:2700123-Rhodomonas_salina.1